MKALKYKKTELHKITEDIRLSPNRRLLALILHMYFDADTAEEKDLMMFLIKNVMTTPSGKTKLYDNEDIKQAIARTNLEEDAKDSISSYLNQIITSKEEDV